MVSRRIVVVAAIVALGVASLAALPRLVDKAANGVHATAPLPVSEAAARLHRGLWIADLHADTLLWQRDLNAPGGNGHVDLPRLVRGNVALQAFSVVTKTPRGLNIERNAGDSDNITLLSIAQRLPPATWSSLMARALYQAGRLHDHARASGGALRVVLDAAQLRRFVAERASNPALVAGWLTLEGAHALEGDPANLERLYRAGFRMAAPTHFFDTELAGSQHGLAKGGLSAAGRAWLREMERRRMIVDLAHASEATIDDVLALATRPVLVSHTGVRSTCPNRRNLSDAHLKKIAAQGGLIGIGFWDTAVCGTDVAAIARAIVHAVNVAGDNHVAYGSDFDGAVTTAIDAAGLDRLTQALLDAGLREEQIRRIAGGNVLAFLLANLPQQSD